MEVYGLVGKSGTGKSYQAMNLCRDRNLEGIIDDGLFIYGGGIMAGISAKRVDTIIAAIKTALFTNEEHRKAVADKIKEVQPANILVLGTSDKMVKKIVERLELPEIKEIIYIDTITTPEQRETAKKQRSEMGKHVIPVPGLQLKRQFSGYILDPLRIFRGWRGGKASFAEKTVVRPTYSYLGDFSISDKVIYDVVDYIGDRIPGLDGILRVSIENSAKEGIRIHITVLIKYGSKLITVAKELQKEVAKQVENMTAFNIQSVDIEVKGIK
jgi:ABC-type dipeptide/oligopeptide/nickel transport system ATPase component